MHQPLQLQLFEFVIQPEIKAIHDPYWDELEAQEEDIVEQAFLSINALDENLDIGVEIAPLGLTSAKNGQPCFLDPRHPTIPSDVHEVRL